MTVSITETDFEKEVLKSDVPVVVDFYATWCGPCKMLSPIIDEVSKESQGKAKFVKIDVDHARTLASQYKIMSVPTIMFFKNGDVADQIIGAVPKDAILNKMNSL